MVVSPNSWQARGPLTPSYLGEGRQCQAKNWKCTNLSKPFFGTYESANTPIGLLNGQIFGILKMFDHPEAYDVITCKWNVEIYNDLVLKINALKCVKTGVREAIL